jgi:hypothetical protein
MKTSNIPVTMLASAVLVLCFSFLPSSSAIAGTKNQVSLNSTSAVKCQPEAISNKPFSNTRISNCPPLVKFHSRKARKHKVNCYKFK